VGFVKDLLEFIFDKNKIHQVLFILPLVIFYLTNQQSWLLLASVIILASMEIYKMDFENKVKIIITNRIKQKSKNKPLIRGWKDQIKDLKKEFNYIWSLPLLIIISIIFFIEFIYSTYLSYNYNKILFIIHIFLIFYFLFLDAIVNHNLNLLAKNKRKKK